MADLNQYIAGGFNADEAAAEAPKTGGNVPDGEYYFAICGEKVEASSDSEWVKDGQVRLCLTFEIKADTQNDTSYSGRKVFDDFWIAHEDPTVLGRSKGYLGKLIVATLGSGVLLQDTNGPVVSSSFESCSNTLGSGVLLQDSKELLTTGPFVAELKTKKGKNGKDYQNMINVRSVEEAQANPKPAPAPAPTAPAAAAPAAAETKKNPWD